MASELLGNLNRATAPDVVTTDVPAAAGAAAAAAAPVAAAAAGGGTARTQAPAPAAANPIGSPTNQTAPPSQPIVVAQPLPAAQTAPTSQPIVVAQPLPAAQTAPPSQPIVVAQPLPTAQTAPTAPPAAQPTAATTPAPSTAPTSPPSVSLAGASVAAPARPTGYTVPAGALRVATSADLSAALNRSTPTDIVLADGVYDNSTYFSNENGHRLYAANLGGAVLRAGISMGGNSGPGNGLVQGLAFDVSSSAKTLQDGIIHVWGTGSGTRVYDVTMNGNNVIGSGIHYANPNGGVVRRVRVRNFTSWGVFAATSGGAGISTPVLLEDLDVAGVSRAVPNSSNGTAEACVWIGNTGTVRRAVLRDCAWMGLWTGGVNTNALLEDIDVDRTGTGIYLEHFTTGSTFQRIKIGSSVQDGFICEWNDPAWGGQPACVNDVIQDATVASWRIGVWLDAGTTGTTVRRVTFVGQRNSAIFDPSGVGNSYADNDYSQIDPAAMPIRKIRNF